MRVASFKLKEQSKPLSPFNWKPETGNWKLRESGFTILELVVVIIIYSVLVTVLLNRLNYYQELAEKAAMEATVRVVKTGLQVRLAELITTNRQAEAARLESEDPMQWLEKKPANYAGDYREPPERGAWYFDARERQLVYVVNTGNRLELDPGSGPREIRFRARLLKDPIQFGGTTVESVTGVTVAPVRPYRWSAAARGAILT